MNSRNRYNTLYAKLGVSEDASSETIQRAYHSLAKIYHPDGGEGGDLMNRAFADVVAAAAILRDPHKRRLYDRGEIDETGTITELGLKRSQRRGSVRIFAVVLFISFIAAAPLSFLFFNNILTSPERTAETGNVMKEDRARQEAAGQNPTGQTFTSRKETASDAQAGSPPPTSALPGLYGDKPGPAVETKSVAPSSATPGKGINYLPPRTAPGPDLSSPQIVQGNPPSLSRTEPSSRIKDAGEGPARSKTIPKPRLSNLEADGDTNNEFQERKRFRGRPSGVNSAACLACLTNAQADCSRLCPGGAASD